MKSRSSKRSLASIVLGFESFVAFFATLAAFGLQVTDAMLVWAIGLTVSLLLILSPALLRWSWGYWVGWALQAALLVSGFWLWGMFLIASLTTGLWVWALVAGSTIDKAREKYFEMQAEGA